MQYYSEYDAGHFFNALNRSNFTLPKLRHYYLIIRHYEFEKSKYTKTKIPR